MKKIKAKTTRIVLVATILGLLGWELLTIGYGESATISEVIWEYLSGNNPFKWVMVFAVGLLAGHLLWQQPKKK